MADTAQQRLIAARRDQILDAAAAVFAERGFHPTTIRDVARRAGVADGTIYNYFGNKSDLLLGIFERMKQSVLAGDTPPPAPEGADLRTLLRATLGQPLRALGADNFALFRVVISEMLVNDEFRARYYEQILRPPLELADGPFRDQLGRLGLDPAVAPLLTRTIMGTVLGLIIERILGDPLLAERWDDFPDFLADLIADGLERHRGRDLN